MKCVSYVRVSSKEQEKEGYSIPAQQKLLREYAIKKSMTVVKEFCDIETAKAAGRTHFGQMVLFLRKNPEIKAILVEKTDRLYRNFPDYSTIIALGVAIHFVKEGVILSRESRSHEKLVHDFKLILAKNYIDNLSEEVKKGMKEKAEQGEWPQRAPFGYVNNKLTKRVEVHREKAELVRSLFAMYATGKFSLDRARLAVFELGMRSSVNRPLSKSMVEAILKNPFYIGDFIWKGKRYQGVHEPIIDIRTFGVVGSILSDCSRPRVCIHDFPYKGLLRCGRCGSAIVGEIKKAKYVYYHCTSAKGKCDQPYIKQEQLDGMLAGIVEAIQISPALALEIRNALVEQSSQELSFRKQERLRLTTRFERLQGWVQKSYEDRLSGVIDAEYWSQTNDSWRKEQEQIKIQLSAFDVAHRNYIETASGVLELAQTAHTQFVKRDSREKRRLLDSVLSNCTIDGLSICPTYAKPFDSIVKGLKMQTMLPRQDSNLRPAD